MQEQIFRDLEKLGCKFSNVETALDMPKNYLSRFKNPENKLPEKWIEPLIGYIKTQNGTAFKSIEFEKDAKTETIASLPAPVMKITAKGELSLAPSPEQLKKMDDAIAGIRKDYGAGAIMALGEKVAWDDNSISTGSLGLNLALGIGGLPRGRIVEIYGPESSGKTTLALHIIAEAQKKGGTCAFIDVEHAFDSVYAEGIGVDVDALKFSQPDYGEQALEEADRLISSGAFSVVVIDSVAALVPKSELEGEMGDSKMGLHARLMSQACRKLTATISKANTICIFINQLRSMIGVVYGNPEVTTGGNALKFYASIRLDVRKKAVIKDGEESVGNRVLVKVVKNKVAPPFKTAEFDIIYGKGISKSGEILDRASELNIVEKSGSWYSYKGSKLGQGREAVKEVLEGNDVMMDEIELKIKEKLQ